MKKTLILFIYSVLLAMCVIECNSNNTDSKLVTDNWQGKWNGPEGTYLELSGVNGSYMITIQNLDGPRTFQGVAVDNQIVFERDGIKESIHPTNGIETGMKWLSDKSNCLTVRLGEGYCRD